jgi:hypothetical protein
MNEIINTASFIASIMAILGISGVSSWKLWESLKYRQIELALKPQRPKRIVAFCVIACIPMIFGGYMFFLGATHGFEPLPLVLHYFYITICVALSVYALWNLRRWGMWLYILSMSIPMLFMAGNEIATTGQLVFTRAVSVDFISLLIHLALVFSLVFSCRKILV